MNQPADRPWLTSVDELAAIPKDGAGRVVVTDPDEKDSVDLGEVLRWGLSGRTHTFAAIVGYFAHRGSELLSDPVGLVAAELRDRSDQLGDDSEERARFQLLYGALCSHESRRALRAWYFACLWRHGAKKQEAVAWRRSVLTALPGNLESVGTFATSLFVDERSSLYCPLLSPVADAWFAPELQDDFREWQRNHGMGEPVVASLFLYLLQRRAEIRFGRTKGKDLAPIRVFHPKLYVIERGGIADADEAKETIVVAGSGNWSAPALSARHEGGGNVEMGMVLRSSGHAWSHPQRKSTGHEFAAAGRAMYRHPRSQILASWTDSSHPSLEEARLALEVQARPGAAQTAKDLETETPPESPEERPDLDSATLQLRYAIQRLIEQSLRLNPERARTVATMLEAARDAWGSKRPSGYQIDGAVRLLQILETSRGAMVTDEPGLGKTLIAQLTIAALIKERIEQRLKLPNAAAAPPVRVTIVAPARVLGAKGGRDEPTQWFLYAAEVRHAVRLLLAVDPVFREHAESWTNADKLKLLPLSVTSFGRKIVDGSDTRADIIDDLTHVAASDIVVLDEAHNFRNGSSRATRVLRFCLSLPACGETGWRPKSGTEQQKLEQVWDPKRGRKILLLTATPFNNHIGDIHAQVGHFSKAQTWDGLRKALANRRKAKARGKVPQEAVSGLDPDLEQAIIKRVETVPELGDPYWNGPEPRAHVEALLRLCALECGDLGAHFESSRALDLNAESLTKQGEKGIDATARVTSDTGPVYNWGAAAFSSELNSLFRVVAEALENQEVATNPSEAAEVEASARARIDFFLSAFVVQRSRRQVIDELCRSEAGIRDAATMFRDPRSPRRPRRLASMRAAPDRDNLDRGFLDSLYEVFKPASEGEDGAPRISLEAYRIRYMRGFSIDQRSVGRVTNFIGFQAMTLIKRLQSSPYAFMRTLARGFVLTSLIELALVEALLETRARATNEDFMGLLRRTASEVKRSRSKAAAAQAQQQSFLHRVADGLVLAKQRIMKAAFGTDDEQDASVVIHLLRGEAVSEDSKRAINLSVKSGHFFRTLCSLDGDKPAASKARLQAFTSAVVAGEELLSAGSREEEGSWLGVLLRGVARVAETATTQAGILFDACQGLHLLFGESKGNGLANNIYEGIPSVQGRDMASLAEAMKKLRPSQVTEWLAHRLADDVRLASLVAFVLLHLHASTIRPSLLAGDRVLIFTEYGDTLEYIRAVLTALSVLGQREQVPRTAKLLDTLRSAVSALAPDASALGDVVADDASAPFSHADIVKFQSMNNEQFLALLASLGQEVAVISAYHEGGRRIGDIQAEPDDESALEEDDESALEGESPRARASAGTIGGAPILDAFSPFYQIDLPTLNADDGNNDQSATRAERARKRLETALASPVRVLIATEVLAEGVNLQQAGILVHYDLPWNPTRLIQRNGRIDRRINALVENHEKLATYLGQLGIDAPQVAAASYVVPHKVFHFTVPPIEGSALDAQAARERAQRVRAVLAAKLDNIRRILGLSSWPVVLDQATASAVLDGSLEYETPSLVRRERLLARVRELDASTAPGLGTLAPAGTLTLRVRADDLAHLGQTIAGKPADWSRLRALLLTSWSPHYPRSVPLRSANEWKIASTKNFGGMMPILLLANNAVTWIPHTYRREGKSNKETLLPVTWEYRDGAQFVFIDPADLTRTSQLLTPEAMTSPAALFDTSLDWLAELALSRGYVLIDRCEFTPPAAGDWDWLGPSFTTQPPNIPEVEDGDVGAAMRHPTVNLATGISVNAPASFSANEISSFNLVIVPE